MNRISESQGQVKAVKSQIGLLIGRLHAASLSVKNEQEKAKSKLQDLVKKAAL